MSFNDLTIPVAGIPITVTRTYDSRVKVKKDFGVGWELSVGAGRFTTNRKLGDGWRKEKKVGFGQPLCGQISEPKKHRVEVRLSDREVFRFQPQILNPSAGFGFCEGKLAFFDSGGVRPGAKLELIGQRFVFQQSGESVLRDPDTLALFQMGPHPDYLWQFGAMGLFAFGLLAFLAGFSRRYFWKGGRATFGPISGLGLFMCFGAASIASWFHGTLVDYSVGAQIVGVLAVMGLVVAAEGERLDSRSKDR